MSSVLIFGANGQDGQYLTSYHEKLGEDVLGVVRKQSPSGRTVCVLDISDYEAVWRLISSYRPDVIYQLAGVCSTDQQRVMENHNAVVAGTNNVLEACRRLKSKAKIFIPGSGLQLCGEAKPSMYVIQRNTAVDTALFYREKFGLQTYVGFLYDHESPLRLFTHASMSVAAAAQRIAKGSDEMVTVDDPSVVKEWTFAGDVVKGIMLFLKQDVIHITTIASSVGYSVNAWGVACFESVGMTKVDWDFRCRATPNFVSDCRYLVHHEGTAPFWNKEGPVPGIIELGWQPRVSFKELAGMMTGYVLDHHVR